MFRTRFPRHLTAVLGAAVIATALSACGAGQISQTANQSSAINGGSANLGKLTLRNVHLVGSTDPVKQRAGQTAQLVLVITNEAADTSDKLTSVTTDVGKVALSGDTAVPATGRLFVGAAEGQEPTPAEPTAAATPAAQPQNTTTITHGKAAVQLEKDLANGLTYNFTFNLGKRPAASR